jgi:hypothetical protein
VKQAADAKGARGCLQRGPRERSAAHRAAGGRRRRRGWMNGGVSRQQATGRMFQGWTALAVAVRWAQRAADTGRAPFSGAYSGTWAARPSARRHSCRDRSAAHAICID